MLGSEPRENSASKKNLRVNVGSWMFAISSNRKQLAKINEGTSTSMLSWEEFNHNICWPSVIADLLFQSWPLDGEIERKPKM